MTKIFNVPFAATGDKTSPPNATQSDGSVSYAQGYGFDYERPTDGTDPQAKVFPRRQHNGILNDITTAIGEIQQNGAAIWQTDGSPYPINSIVRYNDANWQSLISNNNDTPGVGAGATSWKNTSLPDLGSLLRITFYRNNSGTLESSVDGSAWASASSTFTAHPLAKTWDIQCIGSGGAGGGAAATAAGQVSAGSGGGAGGYARGIFKSGINGQVVTVGRGKIGIAAASGPSGESTSMGGIIVGTGGIGGTLGPAASPSNQFQGASAGGFGSGGIIQSGGGPGLAAFTSTNAISGAGGSSFMAPGGAPASGTSKGITGNGYGAGGSGGVAASSVSTGAGGGDSLSGLMIVAEYA